MEVPSLSLDVRPLILIGLWNRAPIGLSDADAAMSAQMVLGDSPKDYHGGALHPAVIGGRLKMVFEQATVGPMPDRLMELADALEAAFQRGELAKQGRFS